MLGPLPPSYHTGSPWHRDTFLLPAPKDMPLISSSQGRSVLYIMRTFVPHKISYEREEHYILERRKYFIFSQSHFLRNRVQPQYVEREHHTCFIRPVVLTCLCFPLPILSFHLSSALHLVLSSYPLPLNLLIRPSIFTV